MYERLSHTRHSSAVSEETTVALRVIWLQAVLHPATLSAHPMILGRFPARASRAVGDSAFCRPSAQHRCPQENGVAYLVDNGAQRPRYLAKVVACMAKFIAYHRLL